MPHPTVLVVDDEDLIRWSLKERLGRQGYTVLEAATGEAAMEQAAAADLVLLDLRLPDMDGLAVLRRLQETVPGTPVILMTAFSTIENAVEAMRQGAYHYLRKPFDLDDVVAIVDQARRDALNGATSSTLFRLPPKGTNLDDVERQLLVQALDRSGWNQTHAGRLLGINRDQVRYRIQKFGLTPPTFRTVVTSPRF